MKKILSNLRKSKIAKSCLLTFALLIMAMPMVFATTTTTETTGSTGLTFNFDPQEMFSWTNVMLTALMPCLYITLGIGLAFIIINALKYAFR